MDSTEWDPGIDTAKREADMLSRLTRLNAMLDELFRTGKMTSLFNRKPDDQHWYFREALPAIQRAEAERKQAERERANPTLRLKARRERERERQRLRREHRVG